MTEKEKINAAEAGGLTFSVTQSTESSAVPGYLLFSVSWPVWRFASKMSKPEFFRNFGLILMSGC